MDCRQLEHELAQDPGAPLGHEARAHLSACSGCRGLRADLLLLREVAREGAPELPPGFQLELRRRLYQADDHEQRRRQIAAPPPARRASLILAAAAVMALILGAGLLARHGLDSGSSGLAEAPVTSAVTYHQLRLAVRAQAELDVRFELKLPDGVRLVGPAAEALGRGSSPGWRSRLRPGDNVIELPLQAVPGAAARPIRARLAVGQRVYRAEVSLTNASAGRAGDGQGPRLAWVLEGVSR